MCVTLPFLLLGSFSSSTSNLIKLQFKKKIRSVLTLKVYILSLRHFKDQLYLLWEQGTSGYLSFGHWSRVSGLGGLPECGSKSSALSNLTLHSGHLRLPHGLSFTSCGVKLEDCPLVLLVMHPAHRP